MFIRIPFVATVALILYILLVSCQSDEPAPPAQTRPVSSQHLREGIFPAFPKRYPLAKLREATLSCFDDGRLWKVVLSGSPVRGRIELYTYSTFSAQSVANKIYLSYLHPESRRLRHSP